MRTILEPADREALTARLDAVRADAAPLWGSMDAPAMVRHLSAALAMGLGDIEVQPVGQAWLGRLLAGPMIGFLPWPKGAPTAPELIAPSGVDIEAARAEVHEGLQRMVERAPNGPFGVHPLFGRLSARQWGRLVWRHSDHHLRQFGV